MIAVSDKIPQLSVISQERFLSGRAQLPASDLIDSLALRNQLNEMIQGYA